MGLDKLLYLQGVAAEFINSNGNKIQISDADRLEVLACMLVSDDASQAEVIRLCRDLPQLHTLIAERNFDLDAKQWTQLLPRFQYCDSKDLTLSFYLPEYYRQEIEIEFELENSDRFSCKTFSFKIKIDSSPHCQVVGDYRIGEQVYLNYRLVISPEVCDIDLPAINMGYHHVSLRFVDSHLQSATGIWLVSPSMSYQGEINASASSSTNAWGVSVQVYSLRSEQQWGIGDFGDLTQLIDMVAAQNAGFILLNPLHALDLTKPDEASPYSPDDRCRLNPLYIDIEQVEEFSLINELEMLKGLQALDSRSQEFGSIAALKSQLNETKWLDYSKVSQYKFAVYQQLYQHFCQAQLIPQTARAREFQRFVNEQGESLRLFCLSQAKSVANLPWFTNTEPQFFAYLQFIAEHQLNQCQQHAKLRKMAIGLVRDLAVGAAANSCETRSQPQLFCHQASIGAPPDDFAPQGQNWGLTPIDPIALKRSDYRHFINLLRANMQSCGALRIDHVMSLLRLWWWPKDSNGGAYVYYPVDCLIAILCLESHRARCQVIGEDLGIVPAEIVAKLATAGVLSNELFYFNKRNDQFTAPDKYKQQSLMMLANHDVPTLKAWWQGDDLQLRRELALISSDPELEQAQILRQKERQQLINLLIELQVIAPTNSVNNIDYQELLSAWVQASASGNAMLFSLQLSDLIQDPISVNVPGTWHEYPNWQWRLPKTLKQIANDDFANGLMQQLTRNRNANTHNAQQEVG
ncbi:4-alpha-glucanotransferase [Shewanella sairae]|uniref:4-alpha-glucanotransferase n=1 Tax=Shewanella sairae TaxID=190310 RepID=A0ABQ4PMY2_9GAMM|nr:4-alpha-glucanotransferase [Shewanella sairae]MCL1130139.1 4-alpha-glucanotransferase [Shewanella sairae]GIU49725.1 4-alpha-glucanotransferase [Shewanella sairae]